MGRRGWSESSGLVDPDSAFRMKREVCLSMQVTPLVGELTPHRQLQNPGAPVPSPCALEPKLCKKTELQLEKPTRCKEDSVQPEKKRMDEQLDPTVYCRKLDSISWDKPRWKRTLKRMDICVKRVTFL